jgi:hypothetical protein
MQTTRPSVHTNLSYMDTVPDIKALLRRPHLSVGPLLLWSAVLRASKPT